MIIKNYVLFTEQGVYRYSGGQSLNTICNRVRDELNIKELYGFEFVDEESYYDWIRMYLENCYDLNYVGTEYKNE